MPEPLAEPLPEPLAEPLTEPLTATSVEIEVRFTGRTPASDWVPRWRGFATPRDAAHFLERLESRKVFGGRFATSQPWQKRLVEVTRTVIDPTTLRPVETVRLSA